MINADRDLIVVGGVTFSTALTAVCFSTRVSFLAALVTYAGPVLFATASGIATYHMIKNIYGKLDMANDNIELNKILSQCIMHSKLAETHANQLKNKLDELDKLKKSFSNPIQYEDEIINENS